MQATATAHTAPTLPTTRAPQRAPSPPAYPGQLRVAGTLTEDARLLPTTGTPPHLFLWVDLQPAQGLRYSAKVDLGTDLADHMAAEALLPHLRAGAVISLAGESLRLRMDHGHAALVVEHPHSVLLLSNPTAHHQAA